MKTLLFISMLLICINASAQSEFANHYIGVRTGIIKSNVHNLQDYYNSRRSAPGHIVYSSSPVSGLSTGLTYQFMAKKLFTFGLDLLYNERGYEQLRQNSGIEFRSVHDYKYLSAQVKGGIQLGNKWYGFANFGWSRSLLLKVEESSVEYAEPKEAGIDLSRFDISALAEVGTGYRIKGRYNIYALCSWQQSTQVMNYFRYNYKKHSGISAAVGFSYALIKNYDFDRRRIKPAESNKQGKHFVGAKVGINRTGIVPETYIEKFVKLYKAGLVSGLTYEYLHKSGLSFGAELLYDQQGYATEFLVFISAYIPSKDNVRYNYVSVPLKAGYRFGSRWFGLVNLGVVPSVLVNANIHSYFGFRDVDKWDITQRTEKYNFSAMGEIGFGHQFNKRCSWITTFSYQHSLVRFNNYAYGEAHGNTLMGVSTSFGIKYLLNQEP